MSHQNHGDERESDDQSRAECRKRRKFTAEDKARITKAADACVRRGELSELLRREGITYSHLATWRRILTQFGPDGLESKRPGPKPQYDARDRLILQQRRAIVELERELSIANALLEMQKKAREILGAAQLRIEERNAHTWSS